VGADYHISIETMGYSVPYGLIGQTLDVRMTTKEIQVFKDKQEVCAHKRSYGKKSQYSTVRDHMPTRHQEADITWTPERFKRWAAEIEPATLRIS
jgi:hypothetical protein